MGQMIGAASEFYRLRVIRIDVTDEPDLEWHDDILYRDPPVEVTEEEEDWRLEAVHLEDESAHEIAQFTEEDQARVLMLAIQDDLIAMTKSEFEDRYLTTAGPRFTDDVPVLRSGDEPGDRTSADAGDAARGVVGELSSDTAERDADTE